MALSNLFQTVLSKAKETFPLTTKVASKIPQGVSAVGSKIVDYSNKEAQARVGLSTAELAKRDIGKMGTFIKAAEVLNRQILQSPLRMATRAGLSAIEKYSGKPQSINLSSPVAKSLYGDSSLSTFQKSTEEGSEMLRSFGGSKIEAESFPLIGIGLSAALDFTGFGPGKNYLTKIAKSDAPLFIENLLRHEIKKIPDDLVKPLAARLSKITDEKVVKETISEVLNTAWKEQKYGAPKVPKFDPEQYVKEMTAAQDAARKTGISKGSEAVENFFKLAKRKIVDLSAPIEDAFPKQYSENIHNQVDRVLRAPALATQFIKDNNLDKVIQNVDDLKSFDQYLIAKQSTDVNTRGIETGRDFIKDQLLVESFAGKYEPFAKEVVAYSQKLLDYVTEMGMISRELNTRLKEIYPNYVPINRIFSELEKPSGFGSGGIASLSKQNVVMKLQGSTRQIESPMVSIINKTQDAFKQGEKNKAAQIITSFADLPGNPLGLKPLITASQITKRVEILQDLKVSFKDRNTAAKFIKGSDARLTKVAKEYDRVTETIEDTLDTALSYAADMENKTKIDPILKKLWSLEQRQMKIADKLYTGPDAVTLREFTKILDEKVENIKALRSELKETQKLTPDPEKGIITLFREGKREVWEADRVVADAAKALNVQQLNVLGKIMALPIRVARLGITGLSLPFVVSNMMADQVSAFIMGKYSSSMANPLNFIQGLVSAIRKDELYDEVVRNAGMSTSFDLSRNNVVEGIDKLKSQKNIVSKIKYTITRPSEVLQLLEDTVGISEQTTRIQQYSIAKKGALNSGKSLNEAIEIGASQARENTVNFARRGEWGTVLNSAVLFLNAGIQGSRLFMRNMKNNPVRTSTRMAFGLFMPMAVVTAYNLKDPARKEAYDDIAEYEKENNFILIPPNPTKDEDGNWNVYKVKIPPGIGRLTVPVRRFIEQAHGADPVKFSEVAVSILGSVSPIEVSKGTRGVVSSLLPQAFKPSVEGLVNENLFTGYPQVPAKLQNLSPELQVKENTSGTARKIANALGKSPIKTEEFIKGTFGTIAPQILHATDRVLAGMNIISEDEIGGKKVSEAIMARFLKARGGESENKTNDTLKGIIQKRDDTTFRLQQEAEIIDRELSAADKETAKAKFIAIQKENPALAKEIAKLVEQRKKGLDYSDRLMLQLRVETGERGLFIFETLQGMPEDQRAAYYNELKEKGIISKNVAKHIKILLDKSNSEVEN